MSDLLPIIQASPIGGSTHGLSKLRNAIFCGRKANLDAESFEAYKEEHGVNMSLEGEGPAYIGSVAHALLEAYHKGELDRQAIHIQDINVDSDLYEGVRIFSEYTKHFGPEFYGEVLEVEVEHAAREGLTGGVPYTIKPDLVVRATEESVARVEERFPTVLLDPGKVYIIDHKTKKQTGITKDPIQYPEDPQFNLYPIVWQDLHPTEEVGGMIANCMVRHKPMKLFNKDGTLKSFYAVQVPYPDPETHLAMRSILKAGWEALQRNECTGIFAGCVSYGRMCSHLTNGSCSRI